MPPPKTDIDLYTSGTPNGQKINCLFEELGINYKWHKVELSKNEQKQDWFLRINPNGRIPAIVDRTSGKQKRVFEGGAIMLYLTQKYDPEHRVSFPFDSDEYWETVEWIIWMQSGLGPMQGQANHFYRYASAKIQYGIDRYQTETKRLYRVLEDRLAAQEAVGAGLWVVGGKYSIADLCIFSWVNWAEWAGIELAAFPKIRAWLDVIQKRPAVARGVDIPERFEMKEAMKTKEGEEEYARHHSNWVMKGQDEEKGRHE